MARVRQRIHIAGRVQGVGFRAAAAARAAELRLDGSVANAADGSVHAVVEGDAAAVAAFLAWCRQGPRLARVTAVQASPEEPTDERGFRIAR